MVAIEFRKRFLSGLLTGIVVVERLSTAFPEMWQVGDVGHDCITDDMYVIEEVVIDE